MSPQALGHLQARLLDTYGPQHWWPASGRFEVLAGAILTQNTAWTNVERAITNLCDSGALEPRAVLALPEPELAALIRPAGTFNVKARRLRALCHWFVVQGGFRALDGWPTAALRHGLLAVRGVGPETADAILLYAFDRPVFVVDDYTRRILARLGLLDEQPDYETLRARLEAAAPVDADWLNEMHALLVVHAKTYCRVRPRCADCVLRDGCPSAGSL